MPGPPPSANLRRRNAGRGLTVLPAGGRPGPTPKWPLRESSADELELWAELWTTPQAVMWERLRNHRAVARYARALAAAETDGRATLLAEIRQLEDRLGVLPMAMLRLGWTIGELAEDPAPAPNPAAASSSRARRAAAAPAKKPAKPKPPAKKAAAKKPAPATGARARAAKKR